MTPPSFASVEDVVAFRESMKIDAGPVAEYPKMARVEERVILRERNGIPLTAEIYVPKGAGPFPALLYMHGGGWAAGSAIQFRKSAMRLAEVGYVVVNLDYSLAPEHPFPRALEDSIYACRWIAKSIAGYNGDPGSVLIGGSSAGANLAAATLVAFKDDLLSDLDEGEYAGIPIDFAGALLIYGIYDLYLLSEEEPETWSGMIEWMFNAAYLGPHYLSQYRNPLVSPVCAAHLERFPPTYISCGDQDLLVGQSLAMAAALTRVRVPTTLSVVEGLSHAFVHISHILPAAESEVQRMCRWLEHRARPAGRNQDPPDQVRAGPGRTGQM